MAGLSCCLRDLFYSSRRRFQRRKIQIEFLPCLGMSSSPSSVIDWCPSELTAYDRDKDDLHAYWEEYFKIFDIIITEKDSRWCLMYGSPQHFSLQSKIPETVRNKLMLLLDVESPFTSDWRDLAEYLGATNDDIKFLESRKDCHESPTQHVINVFETMNQPLTILRDILVDLGRDDL